MEFTGKERDAETGLDYFGARYYSSAQGRFTSPDAPFADQHPEDPQSWNLYVYGRNNPLRFIDDQGRAVFESAAKLMQVGNDVMGRKRLQPIPKVDTNGNPVLDSRGRQRFDTFCNYGVQQILGAGEDHTLDGMRAADITTFLQNSRNATLLSYEDAVAYAKEGVTIIMAEPGHVAVVAPTEMVESGNQWKKTTGEESVPKVLNVGRENGLKPLDRAWTPQAGHMPQAYILNADKKVIEQRRRRLREDVEEVAK